MEKDFILKVERDFNLFKHSNKEYKKILIDLANILNLKDGFISDQPPTYFAGDIESQNKVVFIGINPGGGKDNLAFESKIRNGSWEAYLDFHLNFFKYYKEGPKIPYYSYLKTCFSSNIDTSQNYFDYCQEKLINIDLIPYHSKNYKVKMIEEVENYYTKNFENIVNFLNQKARLVRYIVIHHKQLVELLSKKNYFNKKEDLLPLKLKNKREVYLTKVKGFKVLIFSRFIPHGGFSRKNVQKALEYISR